MDFFLSADFASAIDEKVFNFLVFLLSNSTHQDTSLQEIRPGLAVLLTSIPIGDGSFYLAHSDLGVTPRSAFCAYSPNLWFGE